VAIYVVEMSRVMTAQNTSTDSKTQELDHGVPTDEQKRRLAQVYQLLLSLIDTRESAAGASSPNSSPTAVTNVSALGDTFNDSL
jgi:hypothetical protein